MLLIKFQPCRYVPGLVWNAYLVLHSSSSSRVIFISHIYEQISLSLCVLRRPARSRPSVLKNYSSPCQRRSWKISQKVGVLQYSWNRVEKYSEFQRSLCVFFFFFRVRYSVSTPLFDMLSTACTHCSLFVLRRTCCQKHFFVPLDVTHGRPYQHLIKVFVLCYIWHNPISNI